MEERMDHAVQTEKEGNPMTFQTLFPRGKAIIAMLHMMGDTREDTMNRAEREIDIYYRNGVDAVLVENYFGDDQDCENALAYLKEKYPDKVYGVNILGGTPYAFWMARRYNAKFIQIDSVCGHLNPKADEVFAAQLAELREENKALVFGGIRFKYQPVLSGRTVKEDLAIGRTRCDAVVVTGSGTGEETPEGKIAAFRQELGDFPLITGAGVTADSVAETLRLCDGVIVGSWFKDEHDAFGDVDEDYVKELVAAARG